MKKNGKLLSWKELLEVSKIVADGMATIFIYASVPGYEGSGMDYPAMRRLYRNITRRMAFGILEAQDKKQKETK